MNILIFKVRYVKANSEEPLRYVIYFKLQIDLFIGM